MKHAAAEFTKGWTAPRNRRRYAAWLVAAWAVFWLVLVGQPCCEALAVTPGHTKFQSASDAAHLSSHVQPDSHDAGGNPDCPEATIHDVAVIDSMTVAPGKPGLVSLAYDQSAVVSAPHEPLQTEVYATPPRLALYLRNLHLLI